MICLQNVSKSYRDKIVLRDINLQIEDGKFVVIIGSSGCGKTTLLKIINKLTPMDRGDIVIDGQSISQIPDCQLRRKIGYVLQDGGLFPHLTVKENIELVLKNAGIPKENRMDRVLELMDMVSMDPKLYNNSYPCQLSGGQKQRIGVARAFATNPNLILMDEPFSALDPLTRGELQDEIVKLQKEYKKTIIFVTHDVDEAIKCADDICVIRDGQIIQHGKPEEILRHPVNDYVKKFVGRNRLWGNPNYIHASDIMGKSPIQISKDKSAFQALQIMLENGINCLMVVSEEKGIFEGIVWLKDLQTLKDDQMSMQLSQFISKECLTVYEDVSLQKIIDNIEYNRLGIIPVLNHSGELKGYLTEGILVSVLSKRYKHEEEEA